MIRNLKDHIKRRLLLRSNDHLMLGPDALVAGSTFGRNVRLGQRSTVLDATIGDYSYIGTGTQVIQTDIGKFCSIAGDVHVGTGGHPSRGTVATHPALYLSRPDQGWTLADRDYFAEYERTTVGNDVWIGAKAIVRDGITIGDGAILGAGTIALRSLEPYGVYVGAPARLVRFRFPEPMIADLLAFRWWDRDDAWLREHAYLFRDPTAFADLIAGIAQPGGD